MYWQNDTKILSSPWSSSKLTSLSLMFLLFSSSKNFCIKHFSYVTKSRIFKILNLRKKANRNFRSTFLKNRLKHLKLYSNPLRWLARSRHMDTFWKTKDWSSHFWESQPFRFWYVEFHSKEDLNQQKQVFILNFRPWPAQKTNIWSIFYENSLHKKILSCEY